MVCMAIDVEEGDSERSAKKRDQFYSGVIEGYYGKPWTAEQRRILFKRMSDMGMNMYMYAPKHDPKHRSLWRQPYSVEEAEDLIVAIEAAALYNITFVYALAPGLDVTFSSKKDMGLMKKKLEQVRGMGCQAFAMLFDDIGLDMHKEDSEQFSSFAHAQVSVTNELYQYLNQPATFLFCPTEYCASRAVPTVSSSEYLQTVGNKLLPDIDVFWTGPGVVSNTMSVASIDELTNVLRRRPLIWENLHANDYDRRRLFLGPFCGRSTALVPKLKGVLTNPNCEFEANYIDMHTMMQWVKSYDGNAQPKTVQNNSLSSDINMELEVEGADSADLSFCETRHDAYQPEQALHAAITDWVHQVLLVDQSASTSSQPSSHVSQPVDIAPMPNADIPSCLGSDAVNAANVLATSDSPPPSPANSDISLNTKLENLALDANSLGSSTSSLADIGVISSSPTTGDDCISIVSNDSGIGDCKLSDVCLTNAVTVDDVTLIVELLYQPHEHGNAACHILQELHWLITKQHVLVDGKSTNASTSNNSPADQTKHNGADNQNVTTQKTNGTGNTSNTVTSTEWHQRAEQLSSYMNNVTRTINAFCGLNNQAVVSDLFPYLWSLKGALSLVHAYINWLGCGHAIGFRQDLVYTIYPWLFHRYRSQSSSTSQEADFWILRGGLVTELQCMLQLGNVGDLCKLIVPTITPAANAVMYNIRHYTPKDQMDVYNIYKYNCDNKPKTGGLSELLGEVNMGAYLSESAPAHCFVLEDYAGIPCGYVAVAPNASEFHQYMYDTWLPSLGSKYPQDQHLENDGDESNSVQTALHSIRCSKGGCGCRIPQLTGEFYGRFTSCVQLAMTAPAYSDPTAAHRLMAVAASVLRSNDSCGVYAHVDMNNPVAKDMYTMVLGMRHVATVQMYNRQVDVVARYV